MEDLALARRVLAGDEAAFGEFFDRFFPRLYRFALVRLRHDGDAAEEIVQRVLIRALRGLHGYRGEAALLTWLCTLCRREIAACYQRQHRSREVSILDDEPDLRAALEALAASGSDDPEVRLLRRELADLVRLTLDHLPGRYGDVLEWKYIQGLSVTEIAERLGVAYKAAESLLTRARVAFRDEFAVVTES
jgi:RNA polymerase sigma-70 factor (ECF subfamily)